MRRILGWGFLALLVAAAVGAIYVYEKVDEIEVARVTPDVHVLYGFGGNVGILRTGEGAVVVDTMTFRMQGREIREKAEQLGGPAQVIINTHYHRDHTHGNPAFAPGLKVVSTDNTLAYLHALDAAYWKGDAAGTLPNATFAGAEQVLEIGGKTVRLLHPGRGHTGGDLVVLFVEDRVLHTGDLFFNGRYPNIDLEAGGSVKEWVASLDRVLALDFDHVIPGHGPVTDRAALVAFQDFMRQLAAVGEEAARTGRSLEDTQAHAAIDADAGYEVISIPFVTRLDRNFVVKRAWQEATGNFKPVPIGGGS